MADTWTITVNGGDLGAASKYAGIPYTTESSLTADWHTVQKMAGFIRRHFIDVNGYNPIRVKRDSWCVTYNIIAHFGMQESTLLTIKKDKPYVTD